MSKSKLPTYVYPLQTAPDQTNDIIKLTSKAASVKREAIRVRGERAIGLIVEGPRRWLQRGDLGRWESISGNRASLGHRGVQSVGRLEG